MSRKKTWRLMVLGLILGVAGRAEAQLIVTLEDPGIQATTVAGAQTETFDDLGLAAGKYNSLSSAYGTYSAPGSTQGIALLNHNQFGGSNNSQYIAFGAESGQAQMTLNLNNSETYFGFEWSAGDVNNIVTFFNGSTSVGSLKVGDLIADIAKRADKTLYYGNPNNRSQDPTEPFAYVNIFTPNTTFNKIVFSNSGSTGTGFEMDNHSFASQVPGVLPGTQVGLVPEAATFVSSGTALLIGLGVAWRRRRVLSPTPDQPGSAD